MITLKQGESNPALEQTACCLKALVALVQQNGVWKGAWDLTYLPDLRDQKGGGRRGGTRCPGSPHAGES